MSLFQAVLSKLQKEVKHYQACVKGDLLFQ